MSEVVKIERMGYGTDAIARLSNGKTVFVDGGVPDDVVEIDIVKDNKSFCRAKITAVLEPSPYRVAKLPKDAIQSGATWAHIDYSCQLDSKQQNVRDALSRVGKFSEQQIDTILSSIIASPHEWGYRNKVELAAFRHDGKFCLGSHESSSSNEIALNSCPLAIRPIEKAPKALTGALRYLQGNEDLGIYRVGVRASEATKSIEVALWTLPSSFPRGFAAKQLKDAIGATSIVRVLAHPGKERKIKRVEVLEGEGCWREKMDVEVHGQSIVSKFRISAPSFFQVNTLQAQKLVSLALEGIGCEEGSDVADVYSGAGTFSIPAAKLGCNVCAIELAGSSTKDLVRNAEANNVDVDVICDDASIALPELGSFDAIIVDPPRSGLTKEVIDAIVSSGAKHLSYVSCDPQTFARDARIFEEAGLHLRKVTPVDMFPQTYHVEIVSVFTR